MERVYVYANQKYHEDTSNATYQDLSSKANRIAVQVESALSFATPEILSIPEEAVAQFKMDTPELKLYEFYLKDILRRKPHVLSAEMEALLADAGEIAEAPDNIFSMFNNADIKFPEIKDEHNETVKITHGRFGQLLESSDRRVRRKHLKEYMLPIIVSEIPWQQLLVPM